MKYALILILLIVLLPATPVWAQSGNLLTNSGFDDSAYIGRPGITGGIPTSWNAWGNFQNSDHESLAALVHSAPYAWRLRTESGLPTGGGYQTVSVQSGATYRFSIYALIWTCNDEQWQCRDDTHTFSDTTSGGRLRIGIDPTGGSDPYSGSIRWSGFASPFTWGSFTPLSIDATASSSQLTVFTYYTADVSMRWHDVFWDDASLVAISSTPANNTNNVSNAAPPATAAPVVARPQQRPDGSQVHVVQGGETLWSIAQAYHMSLDELRDLNNLGSTSIIYAGQSLIVVPAQTTPVPPTSAATRIPSPTPLQQQQQQITTPMITPQPIEVNANPPETKTTSSDSNTTRTIVSVLAILILFGAVTLMGGLVVFVTYRTFRA
jgi:LysM repeat protein